MCQYWLSLPGPREPVDQLAVCLLSRFRHSNNKPSKRRNSTLLINGGFIFLCVASTLNHHTHTHTQPHMQMQVWYYENGKSENNWSRKITKKRIIEELCKDVETSAHTPHTHKHLQYILHSHSILLWELAEWSRVAYSWGQPPWDLKCIKKLMFTLGSFQNPWLNLWLCVCVWIENGSPNESGGWPLRSVIDRPLFFRFPPLGAFCWPKTTVPK